jgi:hypothetical protein
MVIAAVPTSLALTAGSASAADQRDVCQRSIVCAPVNAPVDANALRSVIVLLGG